MNKIEFDSGVKEYEIGSGILRFNPSDYNLFHRFLEAADKIQQVEEELVAGGTGVTTGVDIVRLMSETDKKAKDLLNEVFGGENDFHKILGGINLMSVAGNGERVITNLFHALTPIITEGVERCVSATVVEARAARDARRAEQ